MNDEFDPRQLIENIDQSIKDEVSQEAYDDVYRRIAPMLWALCIREMRRCPDDINHANSVVNAFLNAAIMFAASSVSTRESLPIIREGVNHNLESAFDDLPGVRDAVITSANGQGENLLWRALADEYKRRQRWPRR